ncbi:glycosyltransferase 87 family protein [Opitutus sp. ER46]|uniref:glycosyltransferase 87 family protein n=1 Tax=Opitutus sp. ER46 TaxID=2161864 RepID=UPI000D311721|nr:glycosyltransferase 87 family protein [Opitutus sp. ER46]PTX95543.1 hypothetical protein DB354_08970 [Opitutus sp. ER46]
MNPEFRWQVRWSVLCGVAALVILLAAFVYPPLWGAFGVFAFRPYFADTVAILAAGQAQQAGLDIYLPNPFDPFGRPHVYGPGWLVTGPLGLTVGDASWLGGILVLAFVIAAVAVLAPRCGRDAGLALLALCSPPLMLGMHRANNDLVVFLLLAMGAWLLGRSRWLAAAGGALLGLAATLKLYPFVALPAVWLRPGRWRQRLGVTTLLIAGCLGIVWWWRADFIQALRIAPRPMTVFAYGWKVSALTLAAPPANAQVVAGWLLGGLAVLLALRREARALGLSVPEHGFTGLAFVTCATSWIFCFFANSNYPYRALLLIGAMRLWLATDATTPTGRLGRRQMALWLLALWLSVPKHFLASAPNLAYRPSGIDAPWPWLKFVCGLEQGLMVALTLALLVSVLGVWWRRVRQASRES